MELVNKKCLIGLAFVGLILICPILCHPKRWECNENDPDFKECMRIIIPDIFREYYIARDGTERQVDNEVIKFIQFFGKHGNIKYRCRSVNVRGFFDRLNITNYVADWDRNVLTITTYNPKLIVDSGLCTNGNLGRGFAPAEGSELQILLYLVKMIHTVNFYINRAGKVYIIDWRINMNPGGARLSHPDRVGVENQYDVGFSYINDGLSKAISNAFRNLANHEHEEEVPESY